MEKGLTMYSPPKDRVLHLLNLMHHAGEIGLRESAISDVCRIDTVLLTVTLGRLAKVGSIRRNNGYVHLHPSMAEPSHNREAAPLQVPAR